MAVDRRSIPETGRVECGSCIRPCRTIQPEQPQQNNSTLLKDQMTLNGTSGPCIYRSVILYTYHIGIRIGYGT